MNPALLHRFHLAFPGVGCFRSLPARIRCWLLLAGATLLSGLPPDALLGDAKPPRFHFYRVATSGSDLLFIQYRPLKSKPVSY